jgi:ribosome-binding protein aMBF1 (putative translation factor)
MTKTFGECPICRQGQLVAVKNTASGTLMLICDDCESQWRSPQEAESYDNALTDEERVVPASDEEVSAAGWDKFTK